jgi:hypothetical protein
VAKDNNAEQLLREGASCVLPDFSDPIRVIEFVERIVPNSLFGGTHERFHPTGN